MTHYDTSWIEAPTIQPQDLDKACKQVYVWIVTKDARVVLVSKDGKDWQLPGGKPEPGEALQETAVRETQEETGLDISSLSDGLRFVGYQIVTEVGSETPPYLQVRYLLELNAESSALELGVQGEDNRQSEKDVIRFADAVNLDELARRIPWLNGSPEFTTVKPLIAA